MSLDSVYIIIHVADSKCMSDPCYRFLFRRHFNTFMNSVFTVVASMPLK